MSGAGIALALALAIAVSAAWLSALALLRLPTAFDRLHAVAFLNVACGSCLVVAGFLADGISPRSLKLVVIVVTLLLSSAVQSHATGRALSIREGRRA